MLYYTIRFAPRHSNGAPRPSMPCAWWWWASACGGRWFSRAPIEPAPHYQFLSSCKKVSPCREIIWCGFRDRLFLVERLQQRVGQLGLRLNRLHWSCRKWVESGPRSWNSMRKTYGCWRTMGSCVHGGLTTGRPLHADGPPPPSSGAAASAIATSGAASAAAAASG